MAASLAPLGYLEECLADRVALQLWRLRRAVSYEREVLSRLWATAPDVVRQARDERRDYFTSAGPSSLEDADVELERWRETRRLIAAIPDLGENAELPGHTVFRVGWFVANLVGLTTGDLTVAAKDDKPVPLDDLALDEDQWPAAALYSIVETLAGERGPGWFLSYALDEASRRAEDAAEARDALVAETDALRRRSILPDHHELDKLARYEVGLERSLLRALHELQRLQAARQGGVSAPLALDVDFAVS